MLTPSDLAARTERLSQLSLAFRREILRVQDNPGPLLYVEALSYKTALRDAIAGLETARVVLVKACQRLEQVEMMKKPGKDITKP